MNDVFDIEQMRTRLAQALKDRGLSKRSLSLKTNLGPGYLHSILDENKQPSIGNLAKICSTARVSLSHILNGVELSPETERLVALIEANPTKRGCILSLLEDQQ